MFGPKAIQGRLARAIAFSAAVVALSGPSEAVPALVPSAPLVAAEASARGVIITGGRRAGQRSRARRQTPPPGAPAG